MHHEHALSSLAEHTDTANIGGPLAGTNLTFVNELGSTAQFSFSQGGSITGTYLSKVSGGSGTVSGPITGWFNGYVIAWSVVWSSSTPAITSWTGEVVQGPDGTMIDTLWYLATQTSTPGDPSQFWSAVNAGSDTFTEQQ